MEVRKLLGRPDGKPAVRIRKGENAPSFEWHPTVALDRKLLAHNLRSFRESRLGIAQPDMHLNSDIVCELVEEPRRFSTNRGIDIRHRWQNVEIDSQSVQRIFGNRSAFGDYQSDRFSDIADLRLC